MTSSNLDSPHNTMCAKETSNQNVQMANKHPSLISRFEYNKEKQFLQNSPLDAEAFSNLQDKLYGLPNVYAKFPLGNPERLNYGSPPVHYDQMSMPSPSDSVGSSSSSGRDSTGSGLYPAAGTTVTSQPPMLLHPTDNRYVVEITAFRTHEARAHNYACITSA